jgi:pimeloyl-ACP methyl ester carboxylesterase
MPYWSLKDGVPLYYRDAGRGPTLLLLQAVTFGADYFWQHNLDVLERSCRVIALDLRGNGRSGKPNFGYRIADLAADVAEFIEGLDLTGIRLLGFSLGGLVSLQYLRQTRGARLSKLMIMEMTPRLVSAPGWAHPTFGDFPEAAARAYGASVRADRAVMRGFFEASYAEPLSAAVKAEMWAETYMTPTTVLADIVDDMVEQDFRADLPTIGLPTLLLYGGARNKILPTGVGPWMKSQIPDSELVMFEASGHNPYWEEPARFNEVVARFAAD